MKAVIVLILLAIAIHGFCADEKDKDIVLSNWDVDTEVIVYAEKNEKLIETNLTIYKVKYDDLDSFIDEHNVKNHETKEKETKERLDKEEKIK